MAGPAQYVFFPQRKLVLEPAINIDHAAGRIAETDGSRTLIERNFQPEASLSNLFPCGLTLGKLLPQGRVPGSQGIGIRSRTPLQFLARLPKCVLLPSALGGVLFRLGCQTFAGAP